MARGIASFMTFQFTKNALSMDESQATITKSENPVLKQLIKVLSLNPKSGRERLEEDNRYMKLNKSRKREAKLKNNPRNLLSIDQYTKKKRHIKIINRKYELRWL